MMPVLFIGHGHPLNAIQRNAFTTALARAGADLPQPEAILVVSAHWLSRGSVAVSATEQPDTIYDFGPFHSDLFRVTYSAPGAPRLADRVVDLVTAPAVRVDRRRGLDHGAWTVFAASLPVSRNPRISAEHRRREAAAVPLRSCTPTASAAVGRGHDRRQRQYRAQSETNQLGR